MLRRAALRARRATPRRDGGRVSHGRIKERSVEPTAGQRRYWSSLPDACACCGAPGTVVHHVMADAPGKVGRRDHWLVVRICPGHHNMGDVSVHLLGSEQEFLRQTGVDLVAVAVRNRDARRST